MPINVWSFSTRRSYLCFNTSANEYEYNIIFHDQNPTCGHFEPLLSYRSTNIAMPLPRPPFCTCPYSISIIQSDIEYVEQALSKQGLYIYVVALLMIVMIHCLNLSVNWHHGLMCLP